MPIDNEEKKDVPMVDIDTSGPDVDVDVPEEQQAKEEKEVKVEQTETVEQEKETPVEGAEKDEELESYSKKVKRRIDKLTGKIREAERQKEEALEYARSVKATSDSLKRKYSQLETSGLKDREEKIKSNLKATYATLAAAREAGDLEAEVTAQKEIARLGYEEARLEEQKNTTSRAELMERPVNITPSRRTQQTREPDPKAQEWAQRNTWFGKDSAMTYTAFDIHKKLVDEEDFNPESDEYYAEVDKRIRLEFPHKFDTNEERETTKPVRTVASARRSVKPGRKTVSLTPSQVAIAKKLGVPLEEYAKQLKITKEVQHMTKENKKTTRASQSRAKEVRPTTWAPPSSLDAPPAPKGFKHRWLRTEVLGFDDTKNMSGKLRSGYELVRADEYPDMIYPTMKEGKYAGVIGVGGLVLARIPEEIAQSRTEYFKKQTQERNEAIDNDLMREQHPSMPINADRQTRVTFGGTKKR